MGPAGSAGSEHEARDWAICCSGGGIRSAAYCLGGLQSLEQGGLLAKTGWMVAVSGGSYIATSRALVAHDLSPEQAEDAPAYAPGTPEERSLRCDTRYITPSGSTILVGALSLFLGAICTFIILLAPLFAAAHAWGWLMRSSGVVVPSGPRRMTATVTDLGWWLTPVIATGIALALFIYWWSTLGPDRRSPGGGLLLWWKPDDHDRGADRAWLVSLATTVAASLALAMLAAPPLIAWLTDSTGSLGTITRFIGFGARSSWSWSAVGTLIAAVTAIAKSSQAGLAKWTATSTTKGANAPAPSRLQRLTGRVRQLVLPWLAAAVIVAAGAVFALLWMSDGARAGFSSGQLLLVVAALAVMLLARIAVNVNRLSMHDFYRWRLADAFAVTRRAAEASDPATRRKLFTQAAATRLSDLKGPEPRLVICGTANINAVREVPAGQGGFCITFDPDHVTLHGQGRAAQARTSDYEALVGDRRSTLFDVSAISGAAISPLMGAATRRTYRLLFTVTNVRLGVWLPHPAVVQAARERIESGKPVRRPLLLLAWYLAPHLFWGRDAAKNREREARLWAHVLKLRTDRTRWSTLWYRAMQPTLGLLWAEAAGRLRYRATWMYVTDGGHYDNLGLVEALRRGARHIVVLDASGDKTDTWFTLGGAIELARADAGVEIDLDPTTMIEYGEQLATGQVSRPWAYGRFRRVTAHSGQDADSGEDGEIWVCKLGWWTGAPWDVLAYAKGHPSYPCDSTLQQLYDAKEFSAYQELGAAAALDAAGLCEAKPAESLLPLTARRRT